MGIWSRSSITKELPSGLQVDFLQTRMIILSFKVGNYDRLRTTFLDFTSSCEQTTGFTTSNELFGLRSNVAI